MHDVCSSIHPFVPASPVLRELPLADHGLELIQPDAPLAHPLDDGTAVVLERSVEVTAAGLGPDGEAYRRAARASSSRLAEAGGGGRSGL